VKVALTVAGSDSGGGAGIQADLRTFAALRVFGTSAVTGLTAQNTRTVTRVELASPEMVAAQIHAVLDDFPIAAAKTGMLGGAPVIEAVAAALGTRVPKLVVDPVMIAKSGAALLAADAIETLVTRILPKALVVTPNLPEAEALAKRPVDAPERVLDAAKAIADLGPRFVLVKGGHAEGDVVEDVLWDGRELHRFTGPRVNTRSTHGTGCTLSAAITAWLARGLDVVEAVSRARKFVEGSLTAARPLGAGHGPTHHLFAYYPWQESQD
jgi:hydroxymethylpyrimidine/phosphomethylpyrimidine kinase